jgi:limonene-1,2-epoxide hydrolase
MGDRDGMQPTNAPVALSPDTVDALAVVRAWGRAFSERDLDRLLALSTPDICLGVDDHAAHGHDGLRRMLHRQSYGVAQHATPVRYIARGSTVAVQAVLELRWVDGGELADTSDGVAVFEVSDGRVRSFRPQPDLAAAFHVAGWPPTDIPKSPTPAAQRDRDEDAA